MTRYSVLSPDGFSISRDKTYESIVEAGEALDSWVHNYDAQGYYASNHGRIPIEALALHCTLKEVVMTNKEVISQGIQDSFDELFVDLSGEFELESGDISPEQMIRLESIQYELSKLCLEWAEQNTPKSLKPLFDSMRED
jgi:hypothetical protein